MGVGTTISLNTSFFFSFSFSGERIVDSEMAALAAPGEERKELAEGALGEGGVEAGIVVVIGDCCKGAADADSAEAQDLFLFEPSEIDERAGEGDSLLSVDALFVEFDPLSFLRKENEKNPPNPPLLVASSTTSSFS